MVFHMISEIKKRNILSKMEYCYSGTEINCDTDSEVKSSRLS